MTTSEACAVMLALVSIIATAAAGPRPARAAPTIAIKDGNVVVEEGGKSRQLTSAGRDEDAVLSPDGKTVFFTRIPRPTGAGDDDPMCPRGQIDELRSIRIDGG